MAMKNLVDEQKKKAIAPDPISAAAGGVQAANATKAALVNQASARPAWAASAANQAPAPQGQQAYQMFAPTTAATNQQLQVAREGVGANAAPMQKSLTQMVQSIDPRIRTQAKERQEWRMATPQQRREKIGMAKLQQESRTAKDIMDSSPGWEQLADASGTSLDSYGNSEQFYTPDQIEYKRQAMREFDKEWADVLSNVDKTAFSDPQAIYQLQEQLPSVKKYGDFLGSYRFNAIRKYATPQIRAQMDAEDRNQKLFRDWMVSRGAEEIGKAQEQNGGFRFTNDGTGDMATQIALNRDKDLASGQIWRKFLEETPQVYTAMDGKVQIDTAHAARFNESARQKEIEGQRAYADTQAKQKQAEQVAKTVSAARETVAKRERATGERGRWVVNEQDGSIDDLKQYAEKQAKDLTEREKISATGELLREKAAIAPYIPYAGYDEAGINAEIAKKTAGLEPTQAQTIASQMMQSWQYAQSMGGAEGLQSYLNRIDYLISEYSGEKNDKPTTYGFLPDVVDNGDPPVIDVDKETDEMLKRVGLSVSSREGQLFALFDALQDASKTLEENKEQYAYWRSGKGGGFTPGGERRAAFAEKYFNKYAVNGRLPQNIIYEMWAIHDKIQERMNQSDGK